MAASQPRLLEVVKAQTGMDLRARVTHEPMRRSWFVLVKRGLPVDKCARSRRECSINGHGYSLRTQKRTIGNVSAQEIAFDSEDSEDGQGVEDHGPIGRPEKESKIVQTNEKGRQIHEIEGS